MADKKITELSELGALSQDDVFVVVDDPTGTPITKKISAANLLGGYTFLSSVATVADVVGMKTMLVSNVTSTVASTIRAAEFITQALNPSSNVQYQYGAVIASAFAASTANATIEHAAAKLVLDVSNAASVVANTSGLLIEIANTGVRTQNVTSFITVVDKAANSTIAQTLHLFEVKGASANTTGSTVNANVLLTNCAAGKTANHLVKVRINGSTYWLLAANNVS